MFLKRISDLSEITVENLASFSRHSFSISNTSDFVLLDINDTAENITYKEESDSVSDYYTDVNVKGSFKCEGIDVCVKALLKGVFVSDGVFTIDVVKSVKVPLFAINERIYDPWIASSKCASYLLCKARSLDKVSIRLVCVHPESLDKRRITLTYTVNELELFFSSALSEWAKWTKLYTSHVEKRENTLRDLKFPYDKLRDGQDTIVNEVTAALNEHRPLYINAPTGIGKTSAVLYPALKNIASGNADRIFYLTSKNSLHSVVLDTCDAMAERNGKIRALSLISRNKLCPNGQCNRKECSNSKGHSERLKEALYQIISNDWRVSSECLIDYGRKYRVCPFELARKVALYSDIVVCDYNYVFDPYVSRNELFKSNGRDILLVDEAHNLVDRVKQMHSSFIDIKKIEALQNFDETFSAHCRSFLKTLASVKSDDLFLAEPLDRNSVDTILIEANVFFTAFQEFITSDKFKELSLQNNTLCNEFQKVFSSFKRFISLSEEMNDSYIMFFDEYDNVRLLLVDSSKKIRSICKKMGNGVFFSATLTPEEYYRYMLGATRRDSFVNLESPFNKENFKVISYNLSTRYSEREATLAEVVSVIFAAASSKKGNYFVFLPSYAYLNTVVAEFKGRYPEFDVIFEKPSMTTSDKNEYVDRFSRQSDKSMVAFAVMGGNFSEGVDFAGERLSGAVIVGLGVLPPERSRELSARYFDDRFFDGTRFSYVYPGMNKVFQAGGRVIRSETDRGFLVVIDDRFLTDDYLDNLPSFWSNIFKAKNAQEVSDKLKAFWKE